MTDLRPDSRSCLIDVLIVNHKVANMAILRCYLRYNRNTPPLNGKCASSSCTTNCVCLKLKKPCRPSKRCCPTYSGKIMSFYGLQPTVFTFFYSTANPSPTRLTDIQLPDTQLSDTQLPDIQLPGHSGPRTPRSFGHTAPWTYNSPDIQVFRTFRSFGHTAPWTNSSPDIQVFRISDFGFSKMYIPQPCARRAHRNPPTYIHPTSVGMIYPILTYIFN